MNSSNSSQPPIATIKIYQRDYQLPVLSNPAFSELQAKIQTRQQLIQAGKRSQRRWFGLLSTEEEISFEERFDELEILIQDYNSLLAHLTKHKDAYQQFFFMLTDDLKQIVAKKCQAIVEKELRR